MNAQGCAARAARIPRVVLLSDARNDAGLAAAIRRVPRGGVLVFRHYHLDPQARAERLADMRRVARACGIAVVPAGKGYGAAPTPIGWTGLRLATAHGLRELGAARRARAHAVLLSPVFATRSHPGAKALGPMRFNLLARQSALPVLALGGMTARRMARLCAHGFAAIDGLSVNPRNSATRRISLDS